MSTDLSSNPRHTQADLRLARLSGKHAVQKFLQRIFWGILLVFLTGLGFVAYREWTAAERLSNLMQKIQTEERAYLSQAGQPDSSSDNPQGTEAWSEVITLSQEAMTGIRYLKKLPFIGQDSRRSFAPDTLWEEEPFVAETLEFLRPIFDRLEVALKYPMPNFYPTDPNRPWFRFSNYTLIQEIAGILQLEIAHAVFNQDHPRALRAFGLLSQMVKKHNDQSDLAFQMQVGSLLSLSILESLSSSAWTEDDLQALEKLLAPGIDVRQTVYQTAIEFRRKQLGRLDPGLTTIDPAGTLFQTLNRLPSFRLAVLETADQLVQESQNSDLLNSYQRMTKTLETDIFRAWRGPSEFWNYSVPMIVACKDGRNLTKTALTIKRFQLRTGAWPNKLADLQSMGLTESEYTEVSGKLFGFEVGPLTPEEREFLKLPPKQEPERDFAWLWRTNTFSTKAAGQKLRRRPYLSDDWLTNQTFSYRIR